MSEGPALSIGDLARRTGVAVETLRAWERRYGLLSPHRTSGGHRRYQELDVARVVQARRLVDDGLPISVAARRVAAGTATPAARVRRRSFGSVVRRGWNAVERMDGVGFDEALLDARRQSGVAAMLDGVAVPILHRLGAEWRRDPRNVAREHAASSVVRTHLLQFMRDVAGIGPLCVVACPEGELHDLGPIMAGAAMVEVGWRTVVLGASTPWQSTDAIVAELRPALLLLGVERRPRRPVPPSTWRPPVGTHVVLGGAGAAHAGAGDRRDLHVHVGAFADLPAYVASLVGSER